MLKRERERKEERRRKVPKGREIERNQRKEIYRLIKMEWKRKRIR